MKVPARVLDVESTLEGEKVGMTIDQTALSHIMSVLTDLYSDPELAVIREYSTNAFDAHVESGDSRPIEVTTPTPLAPFFKVRDYGEGLDADDIRDIYSRYGASTKRNSDDVVGMLGLGCKSALTYTDQFTLVGWKDGICTRVVVSRDEDGAGSMTILDKFESDEDSGVEIVVPAKDRNMFEAKAKDFFRFWKDGTVLVNGEEPKKIEGYWIADDLLLTSEVAERLVVMGNVAYPVPDYHSSYNQKYHLVAYVDIGAVAFTPSREALNNNYMTKATLSNILAREQAEKEPALKKIVANSATRHEAIDLYFKFRTLGLNGDTKWKGTVAIPSKFEGEFVSVDLNTYYRTKGWGFVKEVPANTNAIWLVGYDKSNFTPHKRKKLNKWLEDKKIESARLFILTEKLPANSEWIDKSKIFPWQEVKDTMVAAERKTTETRSGRPTGSYDIFIAKVSSRGVQADTLSRKELFYVNAPVAGRWGGHSQPRGFRQLFELHPNATLVTLQANRIAKFIRDFPTAQELNSYLRGQATKWQSSLSNDDRLAYYMQVEGGRYEFGFLKHLDANEIDDPFVKDCIKLYKKDIKHVIDKVNLWSGFAGVLTLKPDALDEKYPLLANLDLTYGKECAIKDLTLYMNCAFAQRKES